MELTPEEFLKLFYSPRFRYIHEVTHQVVQGSDVLDVSLNEQGFGSFFSVNGTSTSGSATIDNLLSLNCNYVDIDVKGPYSQDERSSILQEKLMQAYEGGAPMPTVVVRTKNGAHLYWIYPAPIISPSSEQITTWRDIESRLIKVFDGDTHAKDPTRVLRVPGTKHLKDPTDPFLITIESYRPDNVFNLEELGRALPRQTAHQQEKESALDALLHGVPVGKGLRHAALAQVAGLLLRGANTSEKVTVARENYYKWDQKVVQSPEPWEVRKPEIDAVFESILKREEKTETRGPDGKTFTMQIMSWGDIDSLKFDPDRWRINTLIPKAGAVILASISGEGKTWVALEFAKCISTGAPLFNEDRFKVQKGRVLYIDAENGSRELQRRGRMLSFVANENLIFFPADDLNLNNGAWSDELMRQINEKRIDVVIIDTFRAVAGGLQEEKAEEVRAFFARYKKLKDDDVCIIWLDHFRKPDHFAGKIPKKEHLFGSQDKTASVEVLLMMKKEQNDITMYQRKNRLDREIREFKITMNDEETAGGEKKISLVYAGEVDEAESKKNEAKEYIPEILKEEPRTTKQIKQILQTEKKIGQRNTREALKELLDEKIIERRKKGREDEYFLTEQTDELLQQLDSF
jgi:predicted transcriptional regulator